jgi:hypothetical protein
VERRFSSERAVEAVAHAAIHKVIRRMPRYDHEETF